MDNNPPTPGRRGFLAAGAFAAVAAQAQQRPAMWKPRVGILVNYSEGNVAYAKQEGFTSIGFWAQPGSNLAPGSATDASLDKIRAVVAQSGLYCSRPFATKKRWLWSTIR